jgi:hypothetical protein
MSSKDRNDYNNFKKGKPENIINAPKKTLAPGPIGFFPMYNQMAPMQPMQPMQPMPMYPPFGRQMGGFAYNPQSTLQ